MATAKRGLGALGSNELNLGVYPRLFGNYTGNNFTGWDIEFNNNDKIDIHLFRWL